MTVRCITGITNNSEINVKSGTRVNYTSQNNKWEIRNIKQFERWFGTVSCIRIP